MALFSEVLNGLIIKSVANTIIGPFHERLFIFIVVGVITLQNMVGELAFSLMKWFIRGSY